MQLVSSRRRTCAESHTESLTYRDPLVPPDSSAIGRPKRSSSHQTTTLSSGCQISTERSRRPTSSVRGVTTGPPVAQRRHSRLLKRHQGHSCDGTSWVRNRASRCIPVVILSSSVRVLFSHRTVLWVDQSESPPIQRTAERRCEPRWTSRRPDPTPGHR